MASGALVRRAARLPGGAVATFVVAHLLLFAAAPSLQLAGAPIRASAVGALLLAAGAAALWILRRRAGRDDAGAASAIPAPPAGLAAAGALAALAFCWRVATRP